MKLVRFLFLLFFVDLATYLFLSLFALDCWKAWPPRRSNEPTATVSLTGIQLFVLFLLLSVQCVIGPTYFICNVELEEINFLTEGNETRAPTNGPI